MTERKYFIDFVTNSDAECSSNIDSDEERETETDCDSDDLDDENEGLADHMPHRLLTAPCSTNIKQNLGATNESTVDESSHEEVFWKFSERKKKENKKLEKR